MRASSGNWTPEPTGVPSTFNALGRADWQPSALPLPAADALRLRAALADMTVQAARAAGCAAKMRALAAIHPLRPDHDGDVDTCRQSRRDASAAGEAAHAVLVDVVLACRAAALPPERVIRLVREMTTAIVHTCPDIPIGVASQLDAEIVQWTIAAYYAPA